MKKIERLLTLVLALKNNGRMTAAQLAELLSVNIRTIYRDIDAVSQMNIPIMSLSGREGGYEIMEDYFLPSVTFNKDEILALSIAKKLIVQTEIPGFESFVESAFLKLENIIPRDRRKPIRDIAQRIIFDLGYIKPEMIGRGYFPLIRQSFVENRCLLVGYCSPGKKVREREVAPYFLTFCDGVWYLRGKTVTKSFLWWFRLDRIQYLKLSDQPFTLPADFSSEEYLAHHRYQRLAREKQGTRIVLRMEADLFATVKDDLIFKYGVWDNRGDSFTVSFYIEDYDSLFDFLFRNTNRAELIEPLELRRQLAAKLRGMLAIYEKK